MDFSSSNISNLFIKSAWLLTFTVSRSGEPADLRRAGSLAEAATERAPLVERYSRQLGSIRS
jgi:hypothetical protein